jgi:flagellar hook protein FlgE
MPLTSFYTALTGLNNNSTAINVIGDNLANMNTTGFKSGKANFSELLAGLSGTSSTGNPITIGLGATMNGITRMNTQGTVTNTGISKDVAINGNGFFVVQTDGGLGFTRNGHFSLNDNGNLTSTDGFQLMGYTAVNGTIDTNAVPSEITVRRGSTIPAVATKNVNIISGNLYSGAAAGATTSSPVEILDASGILHSVKLNFTRNGSNSWDWNATIPAEDVGGLATDDPVEIGNGTVNFLNGVMTDPVDPNNPNPTLSISGFTNGAPDLNITLHIYDDKNEGIISASNLPSSFQCDQDGEEADTLSDISFGAGGIISGTSASGRSLVIGQIALADFPNVDGLQKFKGSTFVEFNSSGQPSIGAAGTGSRGQIVGSSLEGANVDMAQEFINLIVAQRAYQANSKVITTTDELYQESINLKR